MKYFFAPLLLIAQNSFAQTTDSTATGSLSLKTLSAVSVTSKPAPVKIALDRTIVNVAALPAAAGANALELMRNLPGVTVDAQENINVSGKGSVMVMIDDRPTYLSAQDLAALLKGIMADDVKEVELLSNPPARFDASGNAGIINIKMKKSAVTGVHSNVGGSWVQSTHARQNMSWSGNWRQRNLNFYWNASGNRGYQETVANNDRILKDGVITQRSLEEDKFWAASLRSGIDYKLNQKSTVGLLFTSNARHTTMQNNSVNSINKNFDTAIQTATRLPQTITRNGLNANYAFTGKRGGLNIDVDWSRYGAEYNNEVLNTIFGKTAGQANDLQVGIQVWSARADWNRQMAKGIKLEGGVKWVHTANRSDLSSFGLSNRIWKQDSIRSVNFLFNERIAAAYGSVRHEGKKWSWQGGLRAEATSVKGKARNGVGTTDNRPDTSYINLFPSLYLQYNVAADHQLLFNASRRIDRPTYNDQNPFMYNLDAFNMEQGNPYLRPQISYVAEAGYSFKGSASLRLRATHTEGFIDQITYAFGNNTVMIPQNAGTRQQLSIPISAPVPIGKKVYTYLYAEPFYQRFNTTLQSFGASQQLKNSSWGFNGYLSLNVELQKGWSVNANSWYNFQNRTTIYRSLPINSVSIGGAKNIGKAWNLRFVVNDLFNTQRWQQTATTENLQLTTYRKWESRNATISFSYRFGNNKIKEVRERQGGNEDELGRLKN